MSRALQQRILDDASGRARALGRGGVVVFDLDSTLFDNRPRQARILAEFGALRGVAALAGCRAEHWTSWFISDAMRQTGLAAEQVSALAPAAREFWRERFFTSRYCVDDVPIEGSVEYVAELVATGTQIAYVTGRHTGMGEGSIAAFARGGLPLPDGNTVHLLLKPDVAKHDDDWKLEAHGLLDRLGTVVAAFDNEPAHINGYRARYPEALSVHLATDDSERPIPIAAGVPSIADFVR
ncbi:MAG: hypothetical protein EXR72_02340 [Myxococcales bacterium]|nr:hypothetical protein [Myxococcales bacterium]